MPAYDNNKNPMPDKICIRNEDLSTSFISYEVHTRFYEAMCKKEFMSQCKLLMTLYAGNHMFKIKVPDNMVYTDDYYTIRGAQNAVMFMHVIALASNKPTSLLDKDMKTLVSVEIDKDKGYQIYLDKDSIKLFTCYGADDEVLECLSYNGSIYSLLAQYLPDNYYGEFMVYGKHYDNKAVGFIYVLNDALKVSFVNKCRAVYIYDKNVNIVCYIKALSDRRMSIFDHTGKKIGDYDLKWLIILQNSSQEYIVKKITTNIEYICDKLLDDKYDKAEAAIHISKLSQNIRSFM